MNETEKLDKLVQKARTSLLEVSSVFPFEISPDTIRVDENKVDIISRHFMGEKHILTMLIKDINTVTMSAGPIFASLNFEVSGFVTGTGVKPYPIKYLWKRDAVIARRLVLGLIAANKEGIDITKIATNELKQKVEEIGKSREFTQIA